MDSSAPRETTKSVTAYVQPRQQAHKTRDKTGAQTGSYNCRKVSNISRLTLTRGEAQKKKTGVTRQQSKTAIHRNPWVLGGIRNHDRVKKNFERCISSIFQVHILYQAGRQEEFFGMVRTTLETLLVTCIGLH